jgi:hypothetical protein
MSSSPSTPLIYRWDLDKTYLQTEFDRAVDLLKTAFQKAEEKRAFPGAPELLRALLSHDDSHVTFVSGSPTQMRKVLERKLKLDGITVDALVLKPNLKNALRGRFRALREQVGYKLPALLEQRTAVANTAHEICFGDDAEADAFIYRLYGDVLGCQIPMDRLRRVMAMSGAYPDQIQRACDLAEPLKKREDGRDPIRRVFIHLERKSAPIRFAPFGARVVPIYNYFQAAAVLFHDGLLSGESLLDVGLAMMERYHYDVHRLANGLQDLFRRGLISATSLRALEAVATVHLPRVRDDADLLLNAFRRRLEALRHVNPLTHGDEGEVVDYEGLLESGALHRKKPGRKRRKSGSVAPWLDGDSKLRQGDS